MDLIWLLNSSRKLGKMDHSPTGVYLLKANNTPYVFIANFEHISHLVLVL